MFLPLMPRLRAWNARIFTTACKRTVRASSRCVFPVSAMSVDDSLEQERKPQGRGWMPSLLRFFSQPSERGKRDREYYEKLPTDAKRALYTCGTDFITLDDIPTWEKFAVEYPCPRGASPLFPASVPLSQKVSLWRGDITRLEIDAIVNAANSSLLGGGGVDGAIHRAAGNSLRDECATLSGCNTGDAKITSGHRLPAKYILHTVGPMDCSEQRLRSCYSRCLELVLENDIRSVVFCCIATGIYGYPNKAAAHIALETVRRWLETGDNADQVDRIIFCVFLKVDYKLYRELLHCYFPIEADGGGADKGQTPPPEETADRERRELGEEEGSSPVMPGLDRSVTEPAKPTASSLTPSSQLQQQHSNPSVQQGQHEEPQPSSPTRQVNQQEEQNQETEEVKGTEKEKQLVQEQAEGQQEVVEGKGRQE